MCLPARAFLIVSVEHIRVQAQVMVDLPVWLFRTAPTSAACLRSLHAENLANLVKRGLGRAYLLAGPFRVVFVKA
jgi:hypothetical protein